MNAHSSGVVQSLASQNNIPASLISSAIINANVAATLSASSSGGSLPLLSFSHVHARVTVQPSCVNCISSKLIISSTLSDTRGFHKFITTGTMDVPPNTVICLLGP